MKHLLAVLLLLTLAAPASAARFVGTWVYSDVSGIDYVRVLRLVVRDKAGLGWGSAVGLGYTPTLEIKHAGGSTVLVTMTGVWEDSTETACLFQLGELCLLVPERGYADYDFVLTMGRTGMSGKLMADDQAEPFRFRMQRYP